MTKNNDAQLREPVIKWVGNLIQKIDSTVFAFSKSAQRQEKNTPTVTAVDFLGMLTEDRNLP
jgi:hypothetical protein